MVVKAATDAIIAPARAADPRFVDKEKAARAGAGRRSRISAPVPQMMVDALVDLVSIAVAADEGAVLTGNKGHVTLHAVQKADGTVTAGYFEGHMDAVSAEHRRARALRRNRERGRLRARPRRSTHPRINACSTGGSAECARRLDGVAARSPPAIGHHHLDRSSSHPVTGHRAITRPKSPTAYCSAGIITCSCTTRGGSSVARCQRLFPCTPRRRESRQLESKSPLYRSHRGGALVA